MPKLPDGWDVAGEFPILKSWHFFNHAAVAPITARAAAALRKYATEAEQDAYLTGRWHKQAEHVRITAAVLIGAEAREVAFVKNTSEGLAFVANGLAWKEGDEILSTAVEYPANVYPWMDVQARFGVRHIMLPEEADRRISVEKLLNAVTKRTRMIALSHVEYGSGYRNDLKTIGAFCRSSGVLFCVDAIQSIGALPVNVREMNIDFLSADGHKWMLGPEGLGIFYCRDELLTQLHPEVGSMNVVDALEFDKFNFTLRSDAKRFECGCYNLPGILSLGASLDLIKEVGIETIWKRIEALTAQIAEGVERKGYKVATPREYEGERSGIVSFASPVHSHEKIEADLRAKKIIVCVRQKRLRASPHFYNSPEQVDVLLDALP